MDQNLHGTVTSDTTEMSMKIETVDEKPSALDLDNQGSSAPSDDTAEGEGGLDAASDELGDTQPELQEATTNTHIVLYPGNSDRFLIPPGDEKAFLKISPASVPTDPPPEKLSAPNSDFSSKAVICLIEAVGRRWGLYKTRERSQLFQSVQEELAAKGHNLPVEKIRRKWNNLIVTYKRVKDRSRETGHAKTSWEFFDLMNATLGDTVGSQIISSSKTKISNTLIIVPLKKIAAKPHLVSKPMPVLRTFGNIGASSNMKSVSLVNSSQISSSSNNNTSTASITNVPIASPDTKVSNMKPVILLNNNNINTSVQPRTLAPSPTVLSSAYPTDPPSSSALLRLTNNTDPLRKTRPFLRLKAPSHPSGIAHSRLSNTQLSSNLQSLSSSSITTSFGTSSAPPCFTTSVTEGQSQAEGEEQSSVYMLQEVLQRQEEQAHTERRVRCRAEARERRRDRREVRMAESLSRIATALELLSSKQDTVIALLQRLADRK